MEIGTSIGLRSARHEQKCCCGGPSYCDVCTHGGGYTAQVTITGFRQTNYQRMPRSAMPVRYVLQRHIFHVVVGTGFIIPCGYSLTHGVAEGGASCCYGYTRTNYCEYNYPFYVMYRNPKFLLVPKRHWRRIYFSDGDAAIRPYRWTCRIVDTSTKSCSHDFTDGHAQLRGAFAQLVAVPVLR